MRIVYASKVPVPSHRAYAVHAMRMCNAFASLGHEVTLFALPPTERVDDPHAYYGVADNFSIDYVSVSDSHVWAGMKYGSDIVLHATQKHSPELIYSRHIYAALCAVRAGIPAVYEAHMPPTNLVHRIVLKWLLRHRLLIQLVVITKALRDEYLRLFPFLDSHKVIVAHDGADLPDSTGGSALQSVDENAGRFSVGYVGNLYPGKGMEIITAIAPKMPEVDFHVVGGRPYEVDRWQAHIEAGNLYFYGQVPHGELGAYLTGFDAVLLPLQRRVSPDGGNADISRWTSPMKLFEYMAYGKAIIASDIPVLKEILEDGRNALIVPSEDPQAWVEAIRRVEKDQNLRRRIAVTAFEDLRERYTWAKRAERVSAVAKTMLR